MGWAAEGALAARACPASHARMSAWPRGKSATALLALRQSVCAVSTLPLAGRAWWCSGTVAAAGSVERCREAWACAQAGRTAAVQAASTKEDKVCAGRIDISRAERDSGRVVTPTGAQAAGVRKQQTHLGRHGSRDGGFDGERSESAGKACTAKGVRRTELGQQRLRHRV